MPKKISRDELLLVLEELDRGEAEPAELEELIEDLELTIPDAEALDVLQNDELTAEEMADQLVGYPEEDA